MMFYNLETRNTVQTIIYGFSVIFVVDIVISTIPYIIANCVWATNFIIHND